MDSRHANSYQIKSPSQITYPYSYLINFQIFSYPGKISLVLKTTVDILKYEVF